MMLRQVILVIRAGFFWSASTRREERNQYGQNARDTYTYEPTHLDCELSTGRSYSSVLEDFRESLRATSPHLLPQLQWPTHPYPAEHAG